MNKHPRDKTARLEISVWWNADKKEIHVSGRGAIEFVSTLNDNPKSLRGNPHLFGKLANVLREQGKPGPL